MDENERTIETYEKNLTDIETLTSDGPSQNFPTDVTGNAIREYANDHPAVDTEGTIHNHNYILDEGAGYDQEVKAAYEEFDAGLREEATSEILDFESDVDDSNDLQPRPNDADHE